MTAAERTAGAADIDYEALASEWEQRKLSDAEIDAMLSNPASLPPGGRLMPTEEAVALLAQQFSVSKEEAAESLKRLRGE